MAEATIRHYISHKCSKRMDLCSIDFNIDYNNSNSNGGGNNNLEDVILAEITHG